MKLLLFFTSAFLLINTTLYAGGGSCSSAINLSVDSNTSTSLQNKVKAFPSSYYYTYYKFTPTSDGTITIKTSDMDEDSDAWLYNSLDDCQNHENSVASDTSYDDDITITYNIKKDTTYYLPIRNYKNYQDYFYLSLALTPSIDNDICYDGISVSGLNFIIGSLFSKTTIPIKNISDDDLTNVEVVLASDSLFSAFEECSVLGGDGSESCTKTSDLSFFDTVTLFNSGIIYDLQTLTPNNPKSAYVESKFTFLDSNDYDLLATYTKNGVTYTGQLSQCQSNVEETSDGRPFTIRNPDDTRNIRGNVKIIGNTVLCKQDSSGQCIETNYPNNDTYLSYIKEIDGFTNSSKAKITGIPDNAEVVWAGFYAQGYTNESLETVRSDLNSKPMYLISPDNTLFPLYPEVIDSLQWQGFTYSTFSTVSALIGKKGSEINGWWTGADIKAREGLDSSLGYFGAWTLVVIYKDINEDFRNITIFDGYTNISSSNSDETIELNGFLTPKSGDINSTFSFFAGEGDIAYTGDKLYFNETEIGNTNNIMYSNTSGFEKTPNMTNNFGIDIQNLDIGTSGANLLSYKETSATVRFTSRGDSYYPSMFAFTTNLYIPKFCYDYAYKQQGVYFTEKNDGSYLPYLVGDAYSDVDVTIFIRNLVDSDIEISDMTLKVVDINTTQAIYKRETTMLARDGERIPQSLSDSSLDVSDSYIKDIPIGTIDSNDFFYLYYTLTPKMTHLDMLLNVQADYTLTFNGTAIPYTLQLGKDMQICSTTNFQYLPANGIFNIVHNDYYDFDQGGSKRYYNLPTQVTSREGDFKLLVLDPADPQHNTLLEDHDILYTEVEMIDAAAFHDTNASCYEPTSAISKKVALYIDENVTSVPFDKAALVSAINEGRTDLTSSAEFYQTARQDTAFRTIYYENVYDQYNQPAYKKNTDGTYTAMWNMDWQGENCVGDVNDNGQSNNNDKVANYCQSGQSLNSTQVEECTKCVSVVKYICSRDNFAIRPEAFLMQLDDENQTATTQQSNITTLANSGSNDASAPRMNLAAGYNYNLEINATNHISNNASPGYTRSFNLNSNARAQYKWLPEAGHDISGCNDTSDQNVSLRFFNGKVDTDTNLNNVGAYKLYLLDRSWTNVDHDAAYMTHHTGDYFTTTLDCKTNSDQVLNVGDTLSDNANSDDAVLNGCQIRSQHLNNEANIQYNDYNITFHPYRFDMNSITASLGLNAAAVSNNSYIYYADISNAESEQMSYHLNGALNAIGYTGSTLSNFVDKCYATPLTLSIKTLNSRALQDTEGNNVVYKARFHDQNASGVTQKALDVNVSDSNPTQDLNIQIEPKHFLKTSLGAINTQLNLNYERKKDKSVNPIVLNFVEYKTECTNAATECTFNADLTTKTAQGKKDLNSSLAIYHYYGRTHVSRARFVGEDGSAPLYYEVFCYGNSCDKSLLQDGNSSAVTDDPRWFVNTKHSSSYGVAGLVNQRGYSASTAYVTVTQQPSDSNNNIIKLHYNEERGYPYKTTMENNASSWLLYNQFNANTQYNEFEVEFNNDDTTWAGHRETDSNTNRNAADKTNRRLMW